MAGYPAHVPRCGVMHHAPIRLAIHDLRWRDAFHLGSGRQIARIHHSQRLIDFPRHKLLERCVGDALHDFPEEEEVDVAVAEGGAGGGGRLLLARLLNSGPLAVPVGLGLDVPPQSGDVQHQLADGDGLLAVALELRDVGLDGLIQFHTAALDQEHDGRGAGDDLCQRSRVEERVLGHRLDGRHQGAVSVGLMIGDTAVLDPEHAAGALLIRDGLVDGGVHFRQRLGVKRGLDVSGQRRRPADA